MHPKTNTNSLNYFYILSFPTPFMCVCAKTLFIPQVLLPSNGLS